MSTTLSPEERHELLRALLPTGVWVTCAGGCMEPTLRRGERVRVVPDRDVRVGDVVLFEARDQKRWVLHRVLFKVPGLPWFVNAGDRAGTHGLGVASTHQVLGRADVPRRRPSPRRYWAALKHAAKGAARALVGL